MAEPTSAYSMFDLILRVSKAAGVAYYGNAGNEKATIPINEFDLEECKSCVNDGIKMFIADAPANGWQWVRRIAEITFATIETTGECDSDGSSTTLVDSDLEDTYDEDDDINGYYVYDLTQEIYAQITDYTASGGIVTVAAWLDYNGNTSSLTPADEDEYSITNLQTIEGDKARYLLPEDFGTVMGKITYAKDSNRGHIIDWCSETEIRTRREVNVNTGHPYRAAIRAWGSRRWELIVDPSPTSADTVIFPYELGFDDLQIVSGIATAGATTSITIGGLANFYPDDYFNGWVGYITAGTGRGSYATITDYTGSSGKFDVADWLKPTGAAGGIDPTTNSGFYVEPVNNKHPAGRLFDEVILSACLAKAEMNFEDIRAGYFDKYLKKDLPAAYAIDVRLAPRKLGKLQSGSGPRREMIERVWNDVTTENDM